MQRLTLTHQEKLAALANKYYLHPPGGAFWDVKKGDYYTSSRADLQLYQVVDVDDEYVYTIYCGCPDNVSKWKKSEFTTEGFGPSRVHVPFHILKP